MAVLRISGRRIEVLFDAETIARRVGELAREIGSADFENLLVVAVLKGSFIFTADLLRAMHEAGLSPEVEFISLSSYKDSTVSSGRVTILRDIESDVRGRSILLIDDILESGRTLAYAKDLMAARGAREVRTCVLLDKPGRRVADIEADFIGFACPDRFVVGYGMDMAHAFRELPFVGVVLSAPEAPSPGRDAGGGGGGMARILLAEDDMSVREFARRALESDGHAVTLAHDGGEAAQALGPSGMHFDLLLADVKMPVMDGIALALKVSRDRPDLPILLMTGFADQRERADGLETLVRDVLAKPFTLDELLAAVGRALKVSEPG